METMETQPQLVNGSRQLAIEIAAQRELALAHPRDVKTVLAKCLAEFAIAPEFAENAFYSIPYKRYDADAGEQVTEMVEGLSVVSSRSIARNWGNCAIASRIASETDETLELEGVFADFETNVFFRRTIQVKKTFISRKTKIVTPLAGTHLTNAVQAGLSKAERNATLAGVADWFKERIFAAAKLTAGKKDKGVKTDAERLDACYAAFGRFGVEAARVMVYIKEHLKGKSTDEIIGSMMGVFNALKDKQTTVEEAFPAPAPEKAGSVKLADIPGAAL